MLLTKEVLKMDYSGRGNNTKKKMTATGFDDFRQGSLKMQVSGIHLRNRFVFRFEKKETITTRIVIVL